MSHASGKAYIALARDVFSMDNKIVSYLVTAVFGSGNLQ